MKKLNRYKLLLFYSNEIHIPNSTNLIIKLVKPLVWKYAKLVGYKKWRNAADALAQKYDYNSSEKCGGIIGQYNFREVMDKSVFSKSVDVEFEGELYKAPVGFDTYLTSLYGDFMQLPPVDKRKTHHHYKVVWLHEKVTQKV